MRYLAIVVLTVGLVACGTTKPTVGTQTSRSATPVGVTDWLTSTVTYSDTAVTAEQVEFRVGQLREKGLVCRPTRAGRLRVLVLAHGAFGGIAEDPKVPHTQCADAARTGWAVIEPSYRGEDGSDGKVEVCLGEVDDVMAMLDIALHQSWADPARVGMLGLSHGGCIALRAVERGIAVQAVATISAPTDLAAADRYLWERFRKGGPDAGEQAAVVNDIERAIGGSADKLPQDYLDRSPNHFLGDLEKTRAALLVVHGDDDQLVPVSAACDFAARAGFASFHLDTRGRNANRELAACGKLGPAWKRDPAPYDNWPAGRFFVTIVGSRHIGQGGAMDEAMFYLAANFLNTRVPG